MAKFEAFRWNFLSSTNPEIGRSDVHVQGMQDAKMKIETTYHISDTYT